MSQRINRREFFRRSSRAAAAATAAGATLLSSGLAEASTDFGLGRHGSQRVEEVPSFCEMCFWKCGILGQVRDGRLVGVRGNPAHPMSQGHLCARGNSGFLLHSDPDRLVHPMIRTGERGEGKFRRASWEEALDLIATRMLAIRERHGASAMALAPHGTSSFFIRSLFRNFGSDSYSVPSYGQCRGPRITAFHHTFGADIGSPERLDFERTELIVLIGSHIGENVHTSQVHQFADAIDRGARLIVVDPRFSVAASKAHEYLPIKPSTDMALLLAWLHLVLAEDGYDRDYVERYTTGVDELRRQVADCTPEWAAAITELPVEQIVHTARMMSAARPAVLIHPGRHTTWYGDDMQRERALALLAAVLGSWGRPGGMFLPSPIPLGRPRCPGEIAQDQQFHMPQGMYPVVEEGVPSEVLVEAMISGKPRPVKGLMTYGQNVIASWPRPERTKEALRQAELVAVVDVLPTEPTLWADVVLPEAAYVERYDAPVAVRDSKQPFVMLRRPIVEPPGEAWGPFAIARELAHRLGEPSCLPCEDEQAMLRHVLAPLAIEPEQLLPTGIYELAAGNPYLPAGADYRFNTPSGKIEIFSEPLEQRGVAPLPGYSVHPGPPPGFFRLLYGRTPVHSFARSQNNPLLDEIQPVNQLWINDAKAEELGIADGDPVELVGADGVASNPLPAKVTPGIREDCVFTPHGFGSESPLLHRAYRRGADDNRFITNPATDPDIGSSAMRANFVAVRRSDARPNWKPPLASRRPRRKGAGR